MQDIQAYLDYYAIVGDDDGGKMMSPEEFEAYKKRVHQQEQIICVFFIPMPKEKNVKL